MGVSTRRICCLGLLLALAPSVSFAQRGYRAYGPGGHYHGRHWHGGFGGFGGYIQTQGFGFYAGPVAINAGVVPIYGYDPYMYYGPAVHPPPQLLPGYLPPPYVNFGVDPFVNSATRETEEEDLRRWADDLPPAASTPGVKRFVVPSSAEARQKCARLQAQGDMALRKQVWGEAFSKYRLAAIAAADQAAPRFRMGLTLAKMRKFDSAVVEIQRGLALDPRWPEVGETLDELLGPDLVLTKNALIHETAEWVKTDIRDPNRLFLLGVLLHFNEQQEQARQLFETAARLGRSPPHVMAFLNVEAVQPAAHSELQPIPKVQRRPTIPADEAPRPESAPSADELLDPPAAVPEAEVEGPVLAPPRT